VPVRIEEKNGEMYADPVFGKSNLLFAMIRADGVARSSGQGGNGSRRVGGDYVVLMRHHNDN